MRKERNKETGKNALKGIIKFIIIPTLLSIFINWKVGLSFFGIVLFIKIIIIKRRKYFMKDLGGDEVGVKSFFARWKEGIEGITPLGQAWTNLLGTWITLTGVISGMIINALVRMSNQWWWIEIILFGSLILIAVQMIGGLQKYWKFKIIDKAMKEAEEIEENKEEVEEIEMEKLG